MPVTTPTDSNESNESLLPDVRRMADEIRVRIHLAGLEAKDAWAKLEPKLHELEQKAKGATDHAKESIVEFGTMIRRELQELTGRLSREDKTNTDGSSAND